MIRAYWWQGGPRKGNLGDQLARLLCERLSGQRVEFAEPHRVINPKLLPFFASESSRVNGLLNHEVIAGSP